MYTAANTETDGVINFYCNGAKQYVGANCPVEQEHYYTTAYNEATHYDTLEETLAQAVTDGYLTADNIKNFVCFGPGASEDSCGIDNLYRIIGVFNNQIKLIKYDYADTTMLGEDGDFYQTMEEIFYSGMQKVADRVYRYHWNYNENNNSTNDWSTSRLNTVNLNTNYWNYLTAKWQSKIANTTWQVGGNTSSNIYGTTAKTTYTNEITPPDVATTYEDEIGLMYVSDYMYTVDSRNWTKLGYDASSDSNPSNDYRGIKGDSWMFMGDYEWSITRQSDTMNYAFLIIINGGVGYGPISGYTSIRPVFYLNTDVQIYEGHAGTASDPYRIVI